MKVFLSYSTEDRGIAKALASHLEGTGLETWDPAEAIFPGDNWAMRIGKALEQSDAMVVLISPKSVKSENVQHEIQFALTRPRYKGRLIPVVLKPTKDIPWILKRFPKVRLGKDIRRAVKQIAELLKHRFELSRAAA